MKRYKLFIIGLIIITFFSICIGNCTAEGSLKIVGQVVSQDEKTIENATVELYYNNTLINTTTTDNNGNFSFGDVVPGNYSIQANFGNCSSENNEIYVNTTTITSNTTIIKNGTVIIYIPLTDDSDSDGLPDNWEMIWGFNPTNPDDSSGDYDGDGYSNLNEYEMGTDPTDPANYPHKSVPCEAEEEQDNTMFFTVIIIPILIAALIIIFVIVYQYSKITSKKLLEHETRQKILENIKEEPGSHLRGIKDDLGLSMGVLQHHIGILEREEMVKSRFDNGNRRYYPYKFNIEKKPLLKGSQKKMVNLIKEKPGIGPNKIASIIGKSRKTVYYHITELESKGIIWVDKSHKNHKCFMKIDT